MHLHFVQSLEPLQGAGLGQAALSLHLAMREGSVQASAKSRQASVDICQQGATAPHAPRTTPHASLLLATRAADFSRTWPDVIQGVRTGPAKAFYAPELKTRAASAVAQAGWFHGHGFYVWPNFWLGGEARRRHKPLVYHPHGFLDPWILRRSPTKKRLAHWLFEDKNFAHVRWWRALSSKEADQIRVAVGPRALVHVLPNGIDLAEVDRSPSSVSSDEEATSHHPSPATSPRAWTQRQRPKRLLFLSRLHSKKGLDLLVPAWSRVTRDFPDWELLIVGPDEGGYQAVVEKMIAEADCAATCRIHPAVSGPEKHALLRTADLFVLPSYSEGFPMAVLEAAAHRLAVVQTDECNFPELTRAEAAWECRPDLAQLETTLRLALGADDAERAERGARGRQLVEQHYRWEQIARQVFELCAD